MISNCLNKDWYDGCVVFFLFVFFEMYTVVVNQDIVVLFTNQKVDGLISGSSSLCVEVSLNKILNPAHPSGVRMLQGYNLFDIENEQ